MLFCIVHFSLLYHAYGYDDEQKEEKKKKKTLQNILKHKYEMCAYIRPNDDKNQNEDVQRAGKR